MTIPFPRYPRINRFTTTTRRCCPFTVGLLFLTIPTVAQTNEIRGRVTDTKNEALVGVPILLIAQKDTTQKQYTLTDTSGTFRFTNLLSQPYQLQASYLGFDDFSKMIETTQTDLNLGTITLHENVKNLKEIVIKGQTPTAQQKGDTLQLNASAFKTDRDATTEDLIKKMPGITVENGAVKIQGEDIQQVLVDGKPFFGDDPSIALRNLPAEVIEKIEVFDRLSDQAQFTGFNDGNTSKTINIVTRADRNNGTFGRIYGGYGSNNSYSTGGNVNFFNGAHRLTIVGLANNLNQQNFSSQDLLGISSGGGSGGRGGRNRRGDGNATGGSGVDNFLVGQSNGINTSNAIGINFSDDWGKKVTFRGSYFFNNSNNRNEQTILRHYFLSEKTSQLYRENSANSSENYNHRLDFRLEYTINSTNSLLLTSRVRWQNNSSRSTVDGTTTLSDSALLNHTSSNYDSELKGLSLSNTILFRHRFAKRGRSISINLSTDISDRNSSSSQLSLQEFFTKANDSTNQIRQQVYGNIPGYQLSANASYTEPLGKTSQLQINYNTSYRNNDSEKETYRLNPLINRYDQLNVPLSNTFQNDYYANQLGLGYNLRTPKVGFNATFNFQRADLLSDQLFPRINNVRASFNNILPSANLDLRLNTDSRLRLLYRTNTQAPSVTQLQNVLDNTNPLFLTLGNSNLKQSYSHNFTARYQLTKPTKSRSLFVLLGSGITTNYIGTSTLISNGNATFDSISLSQGVQLSRPVNLNRLQHIRSFVTYSAPLSFIKSNLSLTTNYNYNRTPSQINNRINYANNSTVSQGAVLSSNISEKLDFTISYSLSYNQVTNTIQPQLDNHYFYGTTNARLNWLFGPGFVFQTDLANRQYKGLSGSFNQPYTLWNASFGWKFLKNRRGELKLMVFDLLKQNNSISRALTDTYLEDTQSLVLQQYFLMTFTYTLRQFKTLQYHGQDERIRNDQNPSHRFPSS